MNNYHQKASYKALKENMLNFIHNIAYFLYTLVFWITHKAV